MLCKRDDKSPRSPVGQDLRTALQLACHHIRKHRKKIICKATPLPAFTARTATGHHADDETLEYFEGLRCLYLVETLTVMSARVIQLKRFDTSGRTCETRKQQLEWLPSIDDSRPAL
jgi:hypothetical protein